MTTWRRCRTNSTFIACAGDSTPEHDSHHSQLAVPAGQGEEGCHGEERGGQVDDARVEDVDGHGGDQADDAGGHAEEEGPDAWVLRDRN